MEQYVEKHWIHCDLRIIFPGFPLTSNAIFGKTAWIRNRFMHLLSKKSLLEITNFQYLFQEGLQKPHMLMKRLSSHLGRSGPFRPLSLNLILAFLYFYEPNLCLDTVCRKDSKSINKCFKLQHKIIWKAYSSLTYILCFYNLLNEV